MPCLRRGQDSALSIAIFHDVTYLNKALSASPPPPTLRMVALSVELGRDACSSAWVALSWLLLCCVQLGIIGDQVHHQWGIHMESILQALVAWSRHTGQRVGWDAKLEVISIKVEEAGEGRMLREKGRMKPWGMWNKHQK